MENTPKKKKLDCTDSLNDCTPCSFSQDGYPSSTNGNMKNITSSPPLEGDRCSSASTSDIKNEINQRLHFSQVARDPSRYSTNNEDSPSTRDVSLEQRSASNRYIRSPSHKPFRSPVSEHPPLLLKSCPSNRSSVFESTPRDEQLRRCAPPQQGGSVHERYRHPIFATPQDIETEHHVVSGNNWEKQSSKPYALDRRQYSMQCVTSRKNGSYVNTYCNNTMLNKNIYIDCGSDVEMLNGGENETYKSKTHQSSPFREGADENLHSLGRQYSRRDSLLSTTSFNTHSFLSVSSAREDKSPPEVLVKSSDNKITRETRSLPNRMMLMNFGILEKHDHYIVVYAEINGKRYEGSLGIER